MNSAQQIAKLLLILMGAALCAVLALVAWKAYVQLSATTVKLNLELDEAHRVTLEAGLTAMEARKASALEVQALTGWNQQITTTMRNANGVLLSLQKTSDATAATEQQIADAAVSTLHTTDQTIAGLQPVEAQATQGVAQIEETTTHIQALIDSPDITDTLHNVDVTTGELAKTSTDFQTKFHSVLFPPPCTGHWCWLLRSYGIIKDAGSLAEPTYFGVEAAKAIIH